MKRKVGLAVTAVFMLTICFTLSPPRFWLNLTKSVDLSDPAAAGEQVVVRYDCRSCHRIAGQGALKAPALDDVTIRLDDVSLRLWLRNPRAIKGSTAMPNFHLSDSEIEAVVAYLERLVQLGANNPTERKAACAQLFKCFAVPVNCRLI